MPPEMPLLPAAPWLRLSDWPTLPEDACVTVKVWPAWAAWGSTEDWEFPDKVAFGVEAWSDALATEVCWLLTAKFCTWKKRISHYCRFQRAQCPERYCYSICRKTVQFFLGPKWANTEVSCCWFGPGVTDLVCVCVDPRSMRGR